MLNILTASHDILHNICSDANVASLGNLCSVNKFVRNYLHSEQARGVWMNVGQKVCGKDYWPDDLDPFFPRSPKKYEPRYIAMLMLCPWKSKPYDFGVDPLRGGYAFGLHHSAR